MADKKQNILSIEPPIEGLISEFSPTANPIEGVEGQYRYSLGTTALRPGYRGHIAPAEIFDSVIVTDTTPYINSLPRAVAIDNSQTPNVEWYMLGGASGTGPRVVQVINGATTADHDISAGGFNYTTLPAQGPGFWGEDILFYTGTQSSSTIRFILASVNNSSQGQVALYDIDTSSWITDNFFSGSDGGSYFPGSGINPLPNVPHRMCVGPDRIVYMTNGQYLASWDCTEDQAGVNGTYNNKALNLGLGWIAVDVQPYQNYIAIAIEKTGTVYNSPSENCEARVVLWDGFSLDFNQVYDLNDWYVGSISSIENALYAFTQGANGTTKVKMLPLGYPSFDTIFEMPTSYVGNAPLPNQVEYFNDMVTWASPNQTVFCILKTDTGYAAHTPYYVSNGTIGGLAVGFLKNIKGNSLYAGFHASNGTTYTISATSGDGTSHSMISSLFLTTNFPEFRTRLIDIGYRNSIKKIIVYFSNFGSGSSLYLSLLPNRTAYSLSSNLPVGDLLAWTVNTTNNPNVLSTFTASTSEFGGKLIPEISQFWLNYRILNTDKTATPPMVRKIDIYVEPTEKP